MITQKVTIATPTESKDAEGIVSRSYADVETLDVAIFPTGNDIARRMYGFSENVAYEMVYKGKSSNFKIGNIVKYNNLELPIVYVADYSKAVVALLNTRNSSKFSGG